MSWLRFKQENVFEFSYTREERYCEGCFNEGSEEIKKRRIEDITLWSRHPTLTISGKSVKSERRQNEDRMMAVAGDGGDVVVGVFDGHGGSDVSEMLQEKFGPHFFQCLKKCDGDYEAAMTSAFVSFDQYLMSYEADKELAEKHRTQTSYTKRDRRISGYTEESDDDDDEPESEDQKERRKKRRLESFPGPKDFRVRFAKTYGSTGVVAVIRSDGKVTIGNAGDSRAFLFLQDTLGAEDLISEDHKPQNEAEKRRIEEAGFKVEDPSPHPKAVDKTHRISGFPGLNLSRAFGDFNYKLNESLPYEQQCVTAVPDVVTRDFTAAHTLVLYCDGMVELMPEPKMKALMMDYMEIGYKTPGASLVDLSLVLSGKLKGGVPRSTDNVTALVVRRKCDSKEEE